MRELMLSVGGSDLEWQFFRAGGKGGQAQNKHDSGARVIHGASGARGECREERSQLQNRKRALRRLAESPKFRMWVAEKHQDIERGQTIEEAVRIDMDPKFIKVEVKHNGEWVETTP